MRVSGPNRLPLIADGEPEPPVPPAIAHLLEHVLDAKDHLARATLEHLAEPTALSASCALFLRLYEAALEERFAPGELAAGAGRLLAYVDEQRRLPGAFVRHVNRLAGYVGDPELRADQRTLRVGLLGFGDQLVKDGHFLEAAHAFNLAMRPTTKAPGVRLAAFSLLRLGRVRRRLGWYGDALSAFERCEVLAIDHRIPMAVVWSYIGTARTLTVAGDMASADRYLALAMDHTLGDATLAELRAVARWDLAELRERQGKLAESIALLQSVNQDAALSLEQRITALGDLAVKLRMVAETDAARIALLTVAELAPQWALRVNAMIELVHLAADTNDQLLGTRCIRQVRAEAHRLTGAIRIDWTAGLARCRMAVGDVKAAWDLLEAAELEARELAHTWWLERLKVLRKAFEQGSVGAPLLVDDPSIRAVAAGIPALIKEMREAAG